MIILDYRCSFRWYASNKPICTTETYKYVGVKLGEGAEGIDYEFLWGTPEDMVESLVSLWISRKAQNIVTWKS